MKNTIIILLILTTLSCKAQSIIIPKGSGQDYELTPDYYLKDVNNEFGKFVGTWKYTSGATELTFKLKKEELYQLKNYNYEDLLVGEYQYIENGIEKVNTLSDFDNTDISGYSHKITGGTFMHRLPPYYCTDNSDPAEIKIGLFLKHPTNSDVDGQLVLRYVNDNGTEKLEVCVYDQTTLGDGNERTLIPNGQYVLVKQD